MEGKTPFGSSSTPSSSSLAASGVNDGKKSASPGKSSTSGLFSSVFPPASTVLGRNSTSYDIFAPSKKQESAGQTWNANNPTAGKGQNFLSKDRDSVHQGDTCFLGSSLYYGGRDIYGHPHGSKNYGSMENYKKDAQGDLGSSRGDWWEGSLYY